MKVCEIFLSEKDDDDDDDDYSNPGLEWKSHYAKKKSKKSKELIAPSDFDKKGSPLKLGDIFANKNYGEDAKCTPQTVTIRSTGKDGKIYGRRTIYQKS
jgi:hypothetical protein